VDMIGLHSSHVHLLVRNGNNMPLSSLRGLVSHACRQFLEDVPAGTQQEYAFQDWVQPIHVKDVGRIRRIILRQEQIHRRQTFLEERIALGLERPSPECILLGYVFQSVRTGLQ